jgi:uncharacterized protein YbjT (DUF2867 family)
VSGKPSRVLAFGAAGSAAGEVIPALAARDIPVRGFVRHEEQRQAVLERGADQVALGDLGDRDSIQAALDGVDAVFYLAPAFLPDEAEVGQAVVAAAAGAGVRRFVFSSVIHPVLSLVNHAAKAPVEEALYDSGLEYTVLQPALFFQNYAGSWAQTLRSGVLAEPWSTKTRFSRVDYRDVAEAAAIALTEDRLLGGTYELACDGQLDRHDVADLISGVMGQVIRAERADTPDVPPPMRAMFEHYDSSGLISNGVTLRAVLQRPPRTLRGYFEELDAQGQSQGQAEGQATAP